MDADGFAAGGVNFGDEGGVVGGVAGEEGDGVGEGEFAGDGCAGLEEEEERGQWGFSVKGEKWAGGGGGRLGGLRTPGPTPAMMAMGFDMLVMWDAMEKRRVVGCMWGVEEGWEALILMSGAGGLGMTFWGIINLIGILS